MSARASTPIPARFSTALRKPGRNHKEIYVLDRPNPITGVKVEGPMMDKDLESFVGCFEMPLRHGMTFGELARR